MTVETITDEWVERVAVGGAVLGGGGGGSLEEGIEFGQLAVEYGSPQIKPLQALDPDDVVLTVSSVGAPAATETCVRPVDYVRAVEVVVARLEQRGESVGALMTNEMGGFATVNGLLQSAVTGHPVVDAACNGRAHPTGPMGSIGLSQTDQSIQSAVGGEPGTERRLELVTEAQLATAATTIRRAAEDAGGGVAVARNPVSASYASENAAVEVYEQAEDVGRAVLEAGDGSAAADDIAGVLEGAVPVTGTVDLVDLETSGGFDVGTVVVDGAEMTFWNEYMTLDVDGERVATFPDLITTVDADTGWPISTAEIEEGRDVAVVVAPADRLSLGAGMRERSLFDPVEDAVGKSILEYAFAEGGN